MRQEKMSPCDKIALSIIQNVGCISFHQLAQMMEQLHPRYNAHVTASFMHRLEATRDVKISPDGMYISDGIYQKDKLDRKTIMAITVAMEYITNPNDYETIHKGLGGADLNFYADGVQYAVVINDGTDLAKVAFMQTKYEGFLKKIDKYKLRDKEDVLDSYQTLLIAYPAQATNGEEVKMKKYVKQLTALELTMPHAICFLKDEDIFTGNGVIASEIMEAKV